MSVIVGDFAPHKLNILCHHLCLPNNKNKGVKVKKWILTSGLLAMFSSGVFASSVDGDWVLQDASNTQAKLDAAVNSVADEMNFFVRMIAKPILKKEATICHEWHLSTQSDKWQWQCDNNTAETIPVGASRFETKGDDGRKIYSSIHQTANQVEVVLESERGKRTNIWTQVDPNTITYTAKLESSKLPKPLTWTLTYKHKS